MSPGVVSLVQGTLDVLILRSLSDDAKHGYAISRWGRERTGGKRVTWRRATRVDPAGAIRSE